LCVSFPGLKPWAVFCSPIGRLELAQENVQTPGRDAAGPVPGIETWLSRPARFGARAHSIFQYSEFP
jgi:hypothetical protein